MQFLKCKQIWVSSRGWRKCIFGTCAKCVLNLGAFCERKKKGKNRIENNTVPFLIEDLENKSSQCSANLVEDLQESFTKSIFITPFRKRARGPLRGNLKLLEEYFVWTFLGISQQTNLELSVHVTFTCQSWPYWTKDAVKKYQYSFKNCIRDLAFSWKRFKSRVLEPRCTRCLDSQCSKKH